jgi:sugar phosphate isomerase/epimerase
VELGTAHRYVNGINRLCGCKDFDFIVHSLFPPVKENFMMNFASATGIRDRSIRAAKAAIEFCRRIDAPLYSAHAGFLADIDDLGNPLSQSIAREAAEERIVSALRELCDFAESHRIKVAIENSTGSGPHLLFFSAEQYLSILKEVNSKSLGLLIDLGHPAIIRLTQGDSQSSLVTTSSSFTFTRPLTVLTTGLSLTRESSLVLALEETSCEEPFSLLRQTGLMRKR